MAAQLLAWLFVLTTRPGKCVCAPGPGWKAWQGPCVFWRLPGQPVSGGGGTQPPLGSLGQGRGAGPRRGLPVFCADQHTHSQHGQCVLCGNWFLFRQNSILIVWVGAALPPDICILGNPPVMQMQLRE